MVQLRPLNRRGAASNRRLWPLFSWFFLILVCTVERESYLCGKRLSLRQVVGSRSILYGEKKECFKEMKGPERKGGRKPGKTACWRRRLPLSRTRSSLATSPTPRVLQRRADPRDVLLAAGRSRQASPGHAAQSCVL